MTSYEREVLPKLVRRLAALPIGSSGQIPATVTATGGALREARSFLADGKALSFSY